MLCLFICRRWHTIFFKLKMMFTSKGLKSSSCWKDSKLKLNKTPFELWVVQLSYTSLLKCTKHCPNKNRQKLIKWESRCHKWTFLLQLYIFINVFVSYQSTTNSKTNSLSIKIASFCSILSNNRYISSSEERETILDGKLKINISVGNSVWV